MRKNAGFTLIELVIVIVILGILGAVAAPKLFNLQGDAYGANLNAMKSSISTGMTMANAKAQIKGVLNASGKTDAVVNPNDEDNPEAGSISGYDFIEFVNGYPAALENADTANAPAGILATLQNFEEGRYSINSTGDSPNRTLTIAPSSIEDDECKVIYTEAKSASEPATVIAKTDGC